MERLGMEGLLMAPLGNESMAEQFEGLDQAVHLVIGTDRDTQEVAQRLGIEMTHQDASFTQADEELGRIVVGMTGQDEVGLRGQHFEA